ncbi:hypothetical protein C465_00042 [Halorubrum distributum JCM 9100]|uniref:Uncharacterized protein n=4 Tax=Halorubrum distributum TaxID=29283 RepID=M0F670_9EURY|nr:MULTISPECIES: hypothetical protein [Halorubrum distributum group]ELZ34295.1 hypothetical protein C473_05867 [Halorubrum terrestre JCM 10247]ELZ54129.1 hypothetical protein C465_00042 [Halorubrum distributum JCM 9100]ELZ54389.1 hypothetical protein C466_06122 [Halorubrum distributum JCM 10118]MDV7350095.1 hypothetical protein [Halorubrum distributum]MYL16849.1 hypothetical protein [Halorubrum terrestre]
MEISDYRDAVAANRRDHGFEAVEAGTEEFERMWMTRETDDTLGDVAVLATLVEADETEGDGIDAETLADTAAAFRDVLADRIDPQPGRADGGEAPTPVGYVTFATPEPDASLLDAMNGFTVAKRRTNVFPLVYDTEAERLHRHEVPRLKGRGIYRRQADDAERLFEV